MLISFEDEDLERLYTDADFRLGRFGPELIKAYRKKVAVLVAATDERDLIAMRSLKFEKLKGDRAGQNSIRLNDQWRLIFRIDKQDDGTQLVVIEIVDYH